jgi:hypothetical protein
MALPPEYLTSKMEAMRQKLAAMPLQDLTRLPPLDREDHEMIGAFIQHFNFIDLNLRRALEIFSVANILPIGTRARYPNFRDSELADIAKEAIEQMDPTTEQVEYASQVLNAVSHVRTYRNLMGHFAAKRFPDEDIIVFAGSREQDAKTTLGRSLKRFHIQIALAGRSELRDITLRLSELSDWLAHRIPVWHSRYILK